MTNVAMFVDLVSMLMRVNIHIRSSAGDPTCVNNKLETNKQISGGKEEDLCEEFRRKIAKKVLGRLEDFLKVSVHSTSDFAL